MNIYLREAHCSLREFVANLPALCVLLKTRPAARESGSRAESVSEQQWQTVSWIGQLLQAYTHHSQLPEGLTSFEVDGGLGCTSVCCTVQDQNSHNFLDFDCGGGGGGGGE